MRQVTFVEMAVDYPLAGSSFNYCLAVCPAPTVSLRQHFRSTDTPLPMMPSLCPPQRQARALLLLKSREAPKPFCGTR